MKTWAVQQEAKIWPKWNNQEHLNERLHNMIEKQNQRIGELEKKMARYVGGALVVGSVLAALLSWFLNNVGK